MCSDLPLPLVSCVMLTMPCREAFRAQAVRDFERQTWPNRELVIVDDPGSIGCKRNMGVSRARGEIICHWDDDDRFSPTRIEDQVRRLHTTGAPVTGYHTMLFWDVERRALYRYTNSNTRYAVGVSLCYTKQFWRSHPFADVNNGEDNDFVSRAAREIVCVDGTAQIVAQIHPGNTSTKDGIKDVVETSLLPGWFHAS